MLLKSASRLRGRHFQIIPAYFLRYCTSTTGKTMSKKALLLLPEGAEEMEAVIATDVLRRGDVEVTVAGLSDDAPVKCSRGVVVVPNASLEEACLEGPYDVVVLPGGLGGSKMLAESKAVGKLLRDQEKAGRLIAAICAAPTALKAHQIGIGKAVTSYPTTEPVMKEDNLYVYKQEKVVVDGQFITSRGPGTAFEFALKIVDKLNGREKAVDVAKAMLVSY